jgi:hypothetical protein
MRTIPTSWLRIQSMLQIRRCPTTTWPAVTSLRMSNGWMIRSPQRGAPHQRIRPERYASAMIAARSLDAIPPSAHPFQIDLYAPVVPLVSSLTVCLPN